LPPHLYTPRRLPMIQIVKNWWRYRWERNKHDSDFNPNPPLSHGAMRPCMYIDKPNYH
jgi:hypothetical protein